MSTDTFTAGARPELSLLPKVSHRKVLVGLWLVLMSRGNQGPVIVENKRLKEAQRIKWLEVVPKETGLELAGRKERLPLRAARRGKRPRLSRGRVLSEVSHLAFHQTSGPLRDGFSWERLAPLRQKTVPFG